MNLERIVERLRDYRLKNERFDRLVGSVLSNKQGAKAVRSAVAAARSVSRRGQTLAPGDYDTVFFVAGEMRSGTSWLRHSLSDHPEIACGQEGSFFGRGYDHEEIPVYTAPVSSLTRALAVSKEFKTWHDLPWNLWSDGYEQDLKALSRLSVDYFLSKEVARTGRRIVGDKSPQHTENLDEIYEIYPDARIIHIVRDGRDVAISAMHHWWRLAQDREGGLFEMTPEELKIRDEYTEDREGFVASGRSIFTGERLAQLARRWDYRTGKGRRDGTALYGEKYLEIRYEDLLLDTPHLFGRVLEFLGAGSDEKVIARCLRSSDFERASNRQQGQEDSASFFRKGVAGDWRNVFTERDREIYRDIAGERLVEFSYENSLDW
ncbi:MAG TPA: sulfotransferase [Rubrobacteraceae bacterium]|nr:sulfotransferase [Rubrobacteraceae bacterium]